ncbi:MAG: glycosyltransferase family 2 protein [Candidatus Aenigmatarchaeota archaeon]
MNKSRMDKAALILPAYNEEKNIKIVINEAKKFLPNSLIIVIDDGSKDKTFELAKKSGVVVLRHEKNKGKGEAIKTGFNYLKGKNVDFIIVVDTDRQYQIKDAPKFIKPLKEEKADFVMGKRDWSKVPLRHKFGNFVWRTSFNLLFKQRMEDTNCGFVAFSRKAMEEIKDDIHGGYILEDQMLISAVKNNLKIAQVPVAITYRKRSGFLRGIRMVFGVLIFVIKEGIKYRLGID